MNRESLVEKLEALKQDNPKLGSYGYSRDKSIFNEAISDAILTIRQHTAAPDVVERVSHAMQLIPKSLDETTTQLWERRAKAAIEAMGECKQTTPVCIDPPEDVNKPSEISDAVISRGCEVLWFVHPSVLRTGMDIGEFKPIFEQALRASLAAMKPVSVPLEKTAVTFHKRVKPDESWRDLTVIEREFWRDRVETVLDAAGVKYDD